MQAAAFRDKKGGNTVSAQPRPSSDTAQVPAWLHRAIMSLFVLLALTFLFFITLSILMLLKNSEMSRELLSLKRELWNGESGASRGDPQGCAMKGISEIKIKVQSGNEKLKTVAAGTFKTHLLLDEFVSMLSTRLGAGASGEETAGLLTSQILGFGRGDG
uniref:Uncharacterized protein n=1 Tax=Marmota marmota marmota TaxID=9994 RepID=A0A8C6A3Y8_MARMA